MEPALYCPRRAENPGANVAFPGPDEWRDEGGGVRTCSYCGSLHPEDVFRAAENGVAFTPTDKNYKVYVDLKVRGAGKFYFQHFDDEQKHRFIELMNAKTLNMRTPGHFYVLPFFAQPIK